MPSVARSQGGGHLTVSQCLPLTAKPLIISAVVSCVIATLSLLTHYMSRSTITSFYVGGGVTLVLGGGSALASLTSRAIGSCRGGRAKQKSGKQAQDPPEDKASPVKKKKYVPYEEPRTYAYNNKNNGEKLKKQTERALNSRNDQKKMALSFTLATKKEIETYRANQELKQDGNQYVTLSNAGAAETIGVRHEMEDTHIACAFTVGKGDKKQTVQLYGVFDGHGGKEVAELIRKDIRQILRSECKKVIESDRSLNDETIPDILVETNLQLHERGLPLKGGSCATCALKVGDKIYISNTGDSRTILCRMGANVEPKVQQLSEDANPKDALWEKGIQKRGGQVLGGRVVISYDLAEKYPELNTPKNLITIATAREIGLDPLGVSHRPKITIRNKEDYSEGDYLILACDGLWDVCTNDEAYKALKTLASRGKSLDKIAEALAAGALKSGSRDNVTVMVISL